MIVAVSICCEWGFQHFNLWWKWFVVLGGTVSCCKKSICCLVIRFSNTWQKHCVCVLHVSTKITISEKNCSVILVTRITHHTQILVSYIGILWTYMGFYVDQYLLFCEYTYPLRWNQDMFWSRMIEGSVFPAYTSCKIPVHKVQSCFVICIKEFMKYSSHS